MFLFRDKEEGKFRAWNGYLGPNEHFLSVLLQDWNTVLDELHTTHCKLAHDVSSIIALAMEKGKPNTTVTYNDQLFLVQKEFYMGYQFSLFQNPARNDPDVKWCEEYTIQNVDLKLEVKIGGDKDVGVVQYIDKYGFYEGGGVKNEYRVDPHILHCILCGRCTQPAYKIVEKRERWKKKALVAEKLEYEEKVKKCKEATQKEKAILEELAWLAHRIERSEKLIAEQEKESQALLQHLREKM